MRRQLHLFPAALLIAVVSFWQGVAQEPRERERGSARSAERVLPRPDVVPVRGRLGVQVKNLETGVLITSVTGGSAAERVGLRTGDTIVNVGGYQVGYVDGRLYELGDEISRRIDDRGQVLLLVADRHGRLDAKRVSLASPEERLRIRGQVTHASGNLHIGREAVVTIRVLDVTHRQRRDVVVARHTVPTRGLPMNFSFTVDPANVRADHRYAVDAQLELASGNFYAPPEPLPAVSGDQNVRLVMQTARP